MAARLADALVCVYGLKDPFDDKVRYVGISRDPWSAYEAHCAPSNNFGAKPKNLWILYLRDRRKKPTLIHYFIGTYQKALSVYKDLLEKEKELLNEREHGYLPATSSLSTVYMTKEELLKQIGKLKDDKPRTNKLKGPKPSKPLKTPKSVVQDDFKAPPSPFDSDDLFSLPLPPKLPDDSNDE